MPASDRAFRCRPVVLDENGENDWVAAWTLDRAEPISDGLLAAGGGSGMAVNGPAMPASISLLSRLLCDEKKYAAAVVMAKVAVPTISHRRTPLEPVLREAVGTLA